MIFLLLVLSFSLSAVTAKCEDEKTELACHNCCKGLAITNKVVYPNFKDFKGGKCVCSAPMDPQQWAGVSLNNGFKQMNPDYYGDALRDHRRNLQ